MKTVAVFGGTFDPPTLAHQRIALHILDKQLADYVLVCPTYKNRDGKQTMFSFNDRLAMCYANFSWQDERIRVSDVEEKVYDIYEQGKGSTYNLINFLKENQGIPLLTL